MSAEVLLRTGLRLHVNPNEYLGARIAEKKIYEYRETMFFQRFLLRGMTVIDVGANVGYHAVHAAARVGDEGAVYAFEPDAENYDLLLKNIAANRLRNVVAVNKAVTDKTGKALLYLSAENHGDHRTVVSPDHGRPSVEIETTTLGDYFGRNNRIINFMKVDVQGAEDDVMKGVADILKTNQRLTVLMEFWPHGLRDPGAFLDWLVEMKFRFYKLDGGGRPKGFNAQSLRGMFGTTDHGNFVLVHD